MLYLLLKCIVLLEQHNRTNQTMLLYLCSELELAVGIIDTARRRPGARDIRRTESLGSLMMMPIAVQQCAAARRISRDHGGATHDEWLLLAAGDSQARPTPVTVRR